MYYRTFNEISRRWPPIGGAHSVLSNTRVTPFRPNWSIAASANPGFCSKERLRIWLPCTPVRDVSPLQGYPTALSICPHQFTSTHLYHWVERGTLRLKCLVQGNNTIHYPTQCSNPDHSIQRTNHSATAPTSEQYMRLLNAPLRLPDKFQLMFLDRIQWNLDIMKPQGIGKMCFYNKVSLYGCSFP